VEAVIGRVRPFLQADGGDIVVVAIYRPQRGGPADGLCAGCPSAHMTLHLGWKRRFRDAIPEFETLRVV
jgi:Fe-S cluster biogenesis protein NfuA